MKKKELKNLAQKIAKAERVIQSPDSTTADKSKAEQEIMTLSSHVDKLEDMIIIDDMISSGESMIDTAAALKARKANRIFIFSTFGLFVEGLSKFDEYYEKGLIDLPISATEYISDFIKKDITAWAYYCGEQHRNNLSNRLFNMPSLRNRIIGIQLYLNGMKYIFQNK